MKFIYVLFCCKYIDLLTVVSEQILFSLCWYIWYLIVMDVNCSYYIICFKKKSMSMYRQTVPTNMRNHVCSWVFEINLMIELDLVERIQNSFYLFIFFFGGNFKFRRLTAEIKEKKQNKRVSGLYFFWNMQVLIWKFLKFKLLRNFDHVLEIILNLNFDKLKLLFIVLK